MISGQSAKRRRSSALVITLLCVVLLTIIVVAFMQTMSLALATAKSYADIRRATLAAQAGLDTAIAQIALATSTNMAFVTGLVNYTYTNSSGIVETNCPVTVIGAGNLTNFNQMMPLISGNIAYLTNFGSTNSPTNFAPNFTNYVAAITNIPANPTNTVDINTAQQWIQYTNMANPGGTNMYEASWVTMTNVVGSQTNYTRYAYVVLDDSARMNPALMNGAGLGYTNSTNWYAGPQDMNATYLTNNAGGQALSSNAMYQVTNTAAASNSFGYSDITLAMALGNRLAFETNKDLFTSETNASFDIIPAWYPDGGKPKYNINDLATNTAYGATAMDRATNIATIITNNLPNFYQRDPALTAGPTPDATYFLYVSRLAANIVDYISPDNGTPDPAKNFLNTDYGYQTNETGYGGKYPGISPQGHAIYPILIAERDYVVSGAGSGGSASTTSSVVSQFWLSCWNPYTTPVTITSADLHISTRPGYTLNGGTNNPIPDYANSVSCISGYGPIGGSGSLTVGSATGPALGNPSYVVNPNEFVVMGFAPQTNTVGGKSTTSGPTSANQTNTYLPSLQPSVLEQFALNINGQTVAQSGAQNANAPLNPRAYTSGGLTYDGHTMSTTNTWVGDNIEVYGTEVADPRMESYYNTGWFTHGSQSDSYIGLSWKGLELAGGSRTWFFIYPTNSTWNPYVPGANVPMSMWANRDNMARTPANAGSQATSDASTPDVWADEYNPSDSNAAPEVIRNGPMVSIGELGHVFDPANANDALTAVAPRIDNSGFTNQYVNGGARSLRIGRPEENGNLTTNGAGINPGGGATANSWDTNGERAISLLDLFTVNNPYTTNSTGGGATNSSVIATNMIYGGAPGRINVNTASSNVLAAVLSGIQITSDSGMTNSSGTVISPFLTNIPTMVNEIITNRPYSCLSDLYKTMPMFDTNVNYNPSPSVTPYYNFSDGGYANNPSDIGGANDAFLVYPATLNVFNRVHQEAFGKLVQHLTVQSRSYRIFIIGQVLDSTQSPRGSVVMQVGVALQYSPTALRYEPVIQYVKLLN